MVTLENGSPSIPSLNFTNSLSSGLYLRGPDSVGVSVNGHAVFAFEKDSISTNLGMRFSGGSASKPSIAFLTDQHTGFYKISDGVVGLSSDGVLNLKLIGASDAESEDNTNSLNVMTPRNVHHVVGAAINALADIAQTGAYADLTGVPAVGTGLAEIALSGDYADLVNAPVVGTDAGTLAAGNDSRITGALQRSGGVLTGGITVTPTGLAMVTLSINPSSSNIYNVTVSAGTLTINITTPSTYWEIVLITRNAGVATIGFGPTINWVLGDGTTSQIFADAGVVLSSSGSNTFVFWGISSTIFGKVM